MIGDMIKQRRLELGLTQDELAQMVGYKSRSAVNKIELNLRDLSSDKIVEFSRALKTTPLFLLGLETSAPSESDSFESLFIERYGLQISDIVSRMSMLDEKDLAKVEGFIESLLLDDKYKKTAELFAEKAI